MQDLSLHILDVAENGVRAGADLINITIEENRRDDRLTITIEDNGRGMEPEFLAKVLDPFTTRVPLAKWDSGCHCFNRPHERPRAISRWIPSLDTERR